VRGTAPSLRPRQEGFTLIELLVVIVIAVILTGLAMVSINALGGRQETGVNARRLAALIQLASDDAVMEGREIGIEIRPHSYRFFVWDGAGWQPITDDPSFRQRKLPEEITLDLQLEGQQLVLEAPPDTSDQAKPDNDTSESDASKGPQPQLVALSSGELSAFEITISGPDAPQPYHIRGSVTGTVDLQEPKQ